MSAPRAPRQQILRQSLALAMSAALLVAEDPLIIAVRRQGRDEVGSAGLRRALLDVALAAAMIVYNYFASRAVVAAQIPMIATPHGVGEATGRPGALRRIAVAVDPARVLGWLAAAASTGAQVAARFAERHRCAGAARLLADLATVNALGVPGASIALAARGVPVDRRRSLRQAVLFVGSWFVGAHLVELVIVHAEDVPVLGASVRTTVIGIGRLFDLATDVTRPIGALVVTALLVVIGRSVLRGARGSRDVTDAAP